MQKTSAFSLNKLSLGLTGLGVLLFLAGVMLAHRPDFQAFTVLMRFGGLGLTGIGILSLIMARRQQLYGFSRSRQARYGAQALVLSLSVMGIVALLNYLAYRHDVKWDLTENQSFTLSDQSRQIVAKLNKDVKITAFYQTANSARQQTLNRLEAYRDLSGGKLSFELVDPDRNPTRALESGINTDGIIVVSSGTARKDIMANTEEELTSAILAVTRSDKPKIYFLTGHNEHDPDNADMKMGMSNIKLQLEQENYSVARLSLLAANGGQVPDDAKVLVIAGPTQSLNKSEVQAVKDFIEKRQGKLMLMLAPKTTTGLEGWLATYGINVGNNIVIDPGSNVARDPTQPAFEKFNDHPITKELANSAVTMPLSRTVSLNSLPAKVQGTELMQTTPSSWGETNLEENSLIRKDPVDPPGPLSMAVAVSIGEQNQATEPASAQKPQARMVVIGNAIFAANWFMQEFRNKDFFLNSIAWLTGSEDLIAIRAKPTTDRRLILTGNQEKVVYGLSIYIMPLLMVLAGAFVWWRRR